MQLRTATRSDLSAIRAVAAASLAASYDHILDADLRDEAVSTWYGNPDDGEEGGLGGTIDDPESVVVIAEDGDHVMGFAQAFLIEGAATVGRIEWIHVHPDHRGSGLGEKLLERVESNLTDAGASRLEGRVLEANAEGKQFYAENGYETGPERRLELGDEWLAERTFFRRMGEVDATETTGVMDWVDTDDGEEVLVAYDDSARGTEGPFYAAFLDDERDARYGWFCGACESLHVNMDAMGRLECDNCGNRRKATRWDATYGG
jgi:GNAT superfamily N-acetyltransferase